MDFRYDGASVTQGSETAAGSWSPRLPSTDKHVDLKGVESWFGSILDDLSVGVALVDSNLRLTYANRCARVGIAAGTTLILDGQLLSAGVPGDIRALRRAVIDATNGKRCFLTVGHGRTSKSAAVLPAEWSGRPAAALVFERTKADSALGLYFYARANKLTNAEERILGALSQGRSVSETATEVGCAIATARTHVRSVLSKTNQKSLRMLVARIGDLPPVAARDVAPADREGR